MSFGPGLEPAILYFGHVAGAVLAAAPYFSRYILGVADFGLVFGVLLVPAVIFMPMWAAVGHRLGKRRGFIISSFIFMAGLIGSLAAPLVPLAAALALICVTSVGYAGMQMFPLAMLPDTISDDAARTGEQRRAILIARDREQQFHRPVENWQRDGIGHGLAVPVLARQKAVATVLRPVTRPTPAGVPRIGPWCPPRG